jgi:SAM-dependent methyltransferase
MAADPAKLVSLKAAWSPDALRAAYEGLVTRVLDLAKTPRDRPRFNRILDDGERERLAPAIEQLHALAPETMKKKIARANVQQAFVLEAVKHFAERYAKPDMLCVGSFEDTASESLKALGFSIEEIDPAINCDLETFSRLGTTAPRSYDIIFSTSVIEHVPEDEPFVEQIRDLLAPGGVAILTLDYQEAYRFGDPKPQADCRLYTHRDLLGRFLPILEGCDLVDLPIWLDSPPDFQYEGVMYGFAGFVFEKRKAPSPELAEFERAARLQRLSERLAAARRDLRAREEAIEGFKNSRSWRLTAPLRKLGTLRRRLRGQR